LTVVEAGEGLDVHDIGVGDVEDAPASGRGGEHLNVVAAAIACSI
jgi:hypothetical protein